MEVGSSSRTMKKGHLPRSNFMVHGGNRTLIVKMIHSPIVSPMCSNTPCIDWNSYWLCTRWFLGEARSRALTTLARPSALSLSLSCSSWVGGVVESLAVPIHGPFIATPLQLSLCGLMYKWCGEGLESAHVCIPHYSTIYHKHGPRDWPWLIIIVEREMWNFVAIRQLQMKDVDLNAVTLLDWTRIFLEWYVARVIKNGHPRTCGAVGLEYVITI